MALIEADAAELSKYMTIWPREVEQNRTEQNIYLMDSNSTVSRHTYFDITKDSYEVTINVYMDLTTKL